ncbi:MAG: Peptidase family [Pseudomonadota bacterium]
MVSSLLSRALLFLVPLLAFVSGRIPPARCDGLARQSISDSIANRLTTRVPLKQCEYPRFWPHKDSSSQDISLRETRTPFAADSMGPLISSEQSKGLFLRITHYFTTRGYAVPTSLTVIESKAPNAFVRQGREVVVTSAMARQVTEPAEVAFILAHEVAHVALGHSIQGGISTEVAADRLALEAVIALGFNPCSGSSVLERLGSPSQLTLVSVTPRLHALHNQTSRFCG